MNLGKWLHSLGDNAFTNPWRYIVGWVAVLGLLGFLASQFFVAPTSDISIPGTKAQTTVDRISELFPKADGASGRIVFNAKDSDVSEHKDEIDKLVNEINKVEGIEKAYSPFMDKSFISKDGDIAYSQVQLDKQIGSVDEKTISEVDKIAQKYRSDNLQVEVGGALVSQTPGEIIGVGEVIGVGIALMVLVITLGSLIAGGMPIITAVLAVGVSMAGLFSLSKVLEINSTTPVLAVMLGLAVGIDYALFIVNKYRNLALSGIPLRESAGRALGTAGNAVVFAALTVIIALAALSVVNIPFMTIMGLAGAASIFIAALVSLTVIPALLGLAGKRLFTKSQQANLATGTRKKKVKSVKTQGVFWNNWGKAIVKHPILSIVISLALLVGLALPVTDLKLGLPSDQYASKSTTERKAYDLLSDGFGVGFNSPLTVLVEGMPKVSDADRETVRNQALQEFNKQVAEETARQQQIFMAKLQLASTPEEQIALQQQASEMQKQGELQKQSALAEIDKNVEEYAKYVQLNKIATSISKMENIEQIQPAMITNDGTAGILQVIPKTAPADTETIQLINDLRDPILMISYTESRKIDVGVTGAVAMQDDINQKLAGALPVYLLVIVGLSLVLLVIAFRSILVPIKATLGYVLSVLAMFGAVVAVFQWGWFGIADAPGPIISFVPIIASGILFGLAMDYEFFLVSGMHEAHSRNKDPKKSVVEGFSAGAKVVTAAAVIMISVFAGFMTNHETVIQSMGFGLAIGILVDAFIVRMTIVPAVMSLLGNSAWWLPKWLDKRLPHVSIEGESEEK